MDIFAVGATHKQSPIELREQLAFADAELVPALADLRGGMASEAAIISTCNRTEVYIVPNSRDFRPDELKDWLRGWKRSRADNHYIFSASSTGAARHLFEVAAGVDSQVIGDIQIMGQVKTAYQVARDSKALGKLLSRLFSSA